MMGVVPAWKLRELLDEEAIVMHRKQLDNQVSKEKAESGVVTDSAEDKGLKGGQV
jgi:hypothetical protein